MAANETGRLRLELGIAAPDEFYEALLAAHRGLSEEESALVNARLVLLLANQVGDDRMLRAAIDAARTGLGPARASE